MTRILLSAVLLLAGATFASAQMQPAPPERSPSLGKCWDQANHVVVDKATQGRSGQREPGGVTTGSGTSGNAINSSGQRLQTRPSGMPAC